MNALRQRSFKLLSSIDSSSLYKMFKKLDVPHYDVIRPAEAGLIMMRGKVGNTGNRFNVGELLITRCSVAFNEIIGHGYVLGSDGKSAEMTAVIDVMIQIDSHRTSVCKLLDKIETKSKKITKGKLMEVAATKVDFYTMVRGED